MAKEKELNYENYDGKSLIVYGARSKFQKQINSLGGRWNSKQNGWMLPISNKTKLDDLIMSFKNNEVINDVHVYHRDESDDGSDNDTSLPELVEPIPVSLSSSNVILNLDEDVDKDDYKSSDDDDDDDALKNDEILSKLFNKYKDCKQNSKQDSDSRQKNSIDNDTRRNEYKLREEENKIRERQRKERLQEENIRRQKQEENRQKEESRQRDLRMKERHQQQQEENNAKRKYVKQDPQVYNKSFIDADRDDNPYSYYKSFNKKPTQFRKDNNISESESDDDSDVERSSSEDSDSSSDGFPSPGTPKRRDDYRRTETKSYNEIYNKVQDLQRRLSEMEIYNKRRR